jgi:hypothetical protein
MHYSPYTSIFTAYPLLRFMAPANSTLAPVIKLSNAQYHVIIGIGKSIRATKYDDRLEQRAFLDEKTALIVRSLLFSWLQDINRRSFSRNRLMPMQFKCPRTRRSTIFHSLSRIRISKALAL